jgi:hypothetical protein
MGHSRRLSQAAIFGVSFFNGRRPLVFQRRPNAAHWSDQSTSTTGSQLRAGDGVPACKQRHIVAKPDKFFGQVGNDPLAAAIETRRNAFNERSQIAASFLIRTTAILVADSRFGSLAPCPMVATPAASRLWKFPLFCAGRRPVRTRQAFAMARATAWTCSAPARPRGKRVVCDWNIGKAFCNACSAAKTASKASQQASLLLRPSMSSRDQRVCQPPFQ